MTYDPQSASANAFHITSEVSRLLTEAIMGGHEFSADFTVPRAENGKVRQDASAIIQITIKP